MEQQYPAAAAAAAVREECCLQQRRHSAPAQPQCPASAASQRCARGQPQEHQRTRCRCRYRNCCYCCCYRQRQADALQGSGRRPAAWPAQLEQLLQCWSHQEPSLTEVWQARPLLSQAMLLQL
eukprot:9238-Heterococcus_DN1.PRE.2